MQQIETNFSAFEETVHAMLVYRNNAKDRLLVVMTMR